MTAVSIVKIDVDSAEFKRYKELFDDYQAKLKAAPQDWNKLNAATVKAGESAGEAFASQAEGLALVVTSLSSVIRRQTESETIAKRSNSVWKDTLSTTKGILANVSGVTFNLLKWAAFGGIAGLATSALGAGALASSATNLRTTSRNYGVGPGQLQSARAVFGGYFDPDAALGSIANMQSDYAQWGRLAAMGISPQANPGDVLPQVLRGAVQAYRAGGAPLLDAQGYSQVLGVGDIRGLSRLPAGELERTIGRYRETSGKLAQGDQGLQEWQSLEQTLRTAEDQIKNTFIKGLAPLAPNIEKLSGVISDAIADLTQNGTLKGWIDNFGQGIKWVSDYLSSDRLKQDATDFASIVHKLAHPLDAVGDEGRKNAQPAWDVVDVWRKDVGDKRKAWDRENMTPEAFANKYSRGSDAGPGALPFLTPSARQGGSYTIPYHSVAPVLAGLIKPGSDPLGWTANGLPYQNSGMTPRQMNQNAASQRIQVDIQNTPGSDVTAQVNQLVPH